MSTNSDHGEGQCVVILHRTAAQDALLRRVRSEFHNWPALRLTREQAMRLWTIDHDTCRWMFDTLVASHFLEQDEHGRYAMVRHGLHAPVAEGGEPWLESA